MSFPFQQPISPWRKTFSPVWLVLRRFSWTLPTRTSPPSHETQAHARRVLFVWTLWLKALFKSQLPMESLLGTRRKLSSAYCFHAARVLQVITLPLILCSRHMSISTMSVSLPRAFFLSTCMPPLIRPTHSPIHFSVHTQLQQSPPTLLAPFFSLRLRPLRHRTLLWRGPPLRHLTTLFSVSLLLVMWLWRRQLQFLPQPRQLPQRQRPSRLRVCFSPTFTYTLDLSIYLSIFLSLSISLFIFLYLSPLFLMPFMCLSI